MSIKKIRNLYAGPGDPVCIFAEPSQVWAWESAVFWRVCRISDIYKASDITELLATTKKFWSLKSGGFQHVIGQAEIMKNKANAWRDRYV